MTDQITYYPEKSLFRGKANVQTHQIKEDLADSAYNVR